MFAVLLPVPCRLFSADEEQCVAVLVIALDPAFQLIAHLDRQSDRLQVGPIDDTDYLVDLALLERVLMDRPPPKTRRLTTFRNPNVAVDRHIVIVIEQSRRNRKPVG